MTGGAPVAAMGTPPEVEALPVTAAVMDEAFIEQKFQSITIDEDEFQSTADEEEVVSRPPSPPRPAKVRYNVTDFASCRERAEMFQAYTVGYLMSVVSGGVVDSLPEHLAVITKQPIYSLSTDYLRPERPATGGMVRQEKKPAKASQRHGRGAQAFQQHAVERTQRVVPGKRGRKDRAYLANVELHKLDESKRYQLQTADQITFMDHVERGINSILNKLTDSNYEALKQKLIDLITQAVRDCKEKPEISNGVTHVEILNVLISDVFQKAIWEPHFSGMYAELCRELSTVSWMSAPEDDSKGAAVPRGFEADIRRAILETCQREFEKKIDFSVLETLPQDEKIEQEILMRKKMTGNMKFVGELFIKKMIAVKISKRIVGSLLSPADKPPQESIEQLCTFLNTCGAFLDSIDEGHTVVDYCMMSFQRYITAEPPILTSRIRFMMQDVKDLRSRGWKILHVKPLTSSASIKSVQSFTDLDSPGGGGPGSRGGSDRSMRGGSGFGGRGRDGRDGRGAKRTPSQMDMVSGSAARMRQSSSRQDFRVGEFPEPLETSVHGSASLAGATAVATAPKVVAPPAAESSDRVRKSLKADVKEFLVTEDFKELAKIVGECCQRGQGRDVTHVLISTLLNLAPSKQPGLADAVKKLATNNSVSMDELENGLRSAVVESVETESFVDFPKMWSFLASFCADLIFLGRVRITSFYDALSAGARSCSEYVEPDLREHLASCSATFLESSLKLAAGNTSTILEAHLATGRTCLELLPLRSSSVVVLLDMFKKNEELLRCEPAVLLLDAFSRHHPRLFDPSMEAVLTPRVSALAPFVCHAVMHSVFMDTAATDWKAALLAAVRRLLPPGQYQTMALMETASSQQAAMSSLARMFKMAPDGVRELAGYAFYSLYEQSILTEEQILQWASKSESAPLVLDFVDWLKKTPHVPYE